MSCWVPLYRWHLRKLIRFPVRRRKSGNLYLARVFAHPSGPLDRLGKPPSPNPRRLFSETLY